MARTKSTPAIALGRCAMTMTIPLRARTPRIARVSATVAFGIEIRVRFVENDQKRITVECTRKRDPLRLTGGKRCPLLTNRCFVPLRHVDNEFMNACSLGRGDYRFRFRRGRETSDVVSDCTREKLNILWEIANMLAKRFW